MQEPDRDPESEPLRPLSPRQLQTLRTGTYLHVYCPSCGANLNQRDWIHLDMTAGGATGRLKLSPRFNVFDKEMSLDVPSPTELDDISCPRCQASLMNPGLLCERCGSKTARFRIAAVQLEAFMDICVCLGCTWHALTRLQRTRLMAEE